MEYFFRDNQKSKQKQSFFSLAKTAFFYMSPLCPLPVLNLFKLMAYSLILAPLTEAIILELFSFYFVSIFAANPHAVVWRALVTQRWALKSFLNDFTEFLTMVFSASYLLKVSVSSM